MDDRPIDLFRRNIPQYVLDLVPASIARENSVVPIFEYRNLLVFAAADPHDQNLQDLVDKLGFILNRRIEIQLATADGIEYAIRKYYGWET